MKNEQLKKSGERRTERGNAGLVAMIFLALAALTVMTIMASSSLRENRATDQSYNKLNEKWNARAAVNVLASVINHDAPAKLEQDVRWARETCQTSFTLPVFDADSVAANLSLPAVDFNAGDAQCSQVAGGAATSIFGSFARWRDARTAQFIQTGVNQFGIDATKVNIIEFNEIYRRKTGSNANDMAYAARFIVEAKNGTYRTRTSGEIVFGNHIPGCGSSVVVDIEPSTVIRGNAVTINTNFSYANRLDIFTSGGVLLHTENVSEQSAPQTFSYAFSPSATGDYRVVATGSGGCSATSANATVTVTDPPPVCPTIVDFSASSSTIANGGTVIISWNANNSPQVLLEGSPVAASGTQNFVITASRTFTLVAKAVAGCADVPQQITVNVAPPACAFGAPSIAAFSADRTSIAPGDSSNISWNINGLQAGGNIQLTGANGLNQTVGSSGTISVSPPSAPGDYTYTITAQNVCPDGTVLTSANNITISVRACPPPANDVFTASPTVVTQGGTQYVTFAWNVSGTADAISISNGVGGNLPASGTVDVVQPQATSTYTLTSVGCGQTRQTQVTVTVNTCPPPQITGFSSNPFNVFVGGNQLVRLAWTTTGTIDALNISGVGAVAGNYVDILQPQSTTNYVLTANGCSLAQQANLTITAQPVPPAVNSSCNGGDFDTSLISPDSLITLFKPASSVAVQPNSGNPGLLDVYVRFTSLQPESAGNAVVNSYDAVITIPGVNQFQVRASGEDSIAHSFSPPNLYIASTTEARNGQIMITVPWNGTSITQADINGNFYGYAYDSSGNRLDMQGSFGGTSSCP